MKFFLLILLFFLLSALNIAISFPKNPSLDSVFVVDTIHIIGNNKTKSFIILKEMKIKPGAIITRSIIEEDEKRLYKLKLFNSVDIVLYPTNLPRYNVLVYVTERWYIFPIPIFGIKEHDWKKFYYGAGLIHTNFRGMNEKYLFSGTFGYEPSLQIYYTTPNISLLENAFLELSLNYTKQENKNIVENAISESFYFKNFSALITLGRRLNLLSYAWFSLAWQAVAVEENYNNYVLNPIGRDLFPVTSVGYKYDTRDLNDFSMSGTYFTFQLSKFGLNQKYIDYSKIYLDFRRFVPLVKKLSFALNTYSSFTFGGNIPVYNRAYLGYSYKIRGNFTQIYEGENILRSSVEFRYYLFEPKYFDIDIVSIKEFSVWKFGVAATLFADAGKIWFKNEKFKWDRIVKGYGVGINFILPYHLVLRFEYALNELSKGEFIFDLYSSF